MRGLLVLLFGSPLLRTSGIFEAHQLGLCLTITQQHMVIKALGHLSHPNQALRKTAHQSSRWPAKLPLDIRRMADEAYSLTKSIITTWIVLKHSFINTKSSTSRGKFLHFISRNSTFLSFIDLSVGASVIVSTTMVFVLQVSLSKAESPRSSLFTKSNHRHHLYKKKINK